MNRVVNLQSLWYVSFLPNTKLLRWNDNTYKFWSDCSNSKQTTCKNQMFILDSLSAFYFLNVYKKRCNQNSYVLLHVNMTICASSRSIYKSGEQKKKRWRDWSFMQTQKVGKMEFMQLSFSLQWKMSKKRTDSGKKFLRPSAKTSDNRSQVITN